MPQELIAEIPHSVRADLHEMAKKTIEMLKLTWEAFRKQNIQTLQTADSIGRQIHRQEKTLTELMIRTAPGLAGDRGKGSELFFVPMHLERIGDNIEFLVRAIRSMVQEGIPFSERAMGEINTLFGKAAELLECVQDMITIRNSVLVRHVLDAGRDYEQTANDYALIHQQRLIEGVCMPKSSSVYLAILDYLKGIEWHTRLIAKKLPVMSST